jgi:Proteasome beta subunits C terminal
MMLMLQNTQVLRPYTSPNPPPVKQQSYKFEIGTTKVVKEMVVKKFTEGKALDVVSEQAASSAMELD